MRDQADELRSIVLKSARPWTAATGPAPRLVALAGGKGGVGTTTLSLNLAVALAQQGQRVILIDADLERADIATLCHMKERYSIADVLAARRDIHEVLEPGPAGIQVLPGSWGAAQSAHCSPFILERFVQGLKGLGPHAEILVADLGSRIGQIESQLWRAADEGFKASNLGFVFSSNFQRAFQKRRKTEVTCFLILPYLVTACLCRCSSARQAELRLPCGKVAKGKIAPRKASSGHFTS